MLGAIFFADEHARSSTELRREIHRAWSSTPLVPRDARASSVKNQRDLCAPRRAGAATSAQARPDLREVRRLGSRQCGGKARQGTPQGLLNLRHSAIAAYICVLQGRLEPAPTFVGAPAGEAGRADAACVVDRPLVVRWFGRFRRAESVVPSNRP